MLFKKIRPFIIPVAITLTVVILFHSIFFLGYVPTESMEPTLIFIFDVSICVRIRSLVLLSCIISEGVRRDPVSGGKIYG